MYPLVEQRFVFKQFWYSYFWIVLKIAQDSSAKLPYLGKKKKILSIAVYILSEAHQSACAARLHFIAAYHRCFNNRAPPQQPGCLLPRPTAALPPRPFLPAGSQIYFYWGLTLYYTYTSTIFYATGLDCRKSWCCHTGAWTLRQYSIQYYSHFLLSSRQGYNKYDKDF